MLERCVRSVASVSVEHEHVIIDGASTDGTVELLEKLTKSFAGLKYMSEPDTGIYNAFNKGVEKANGEWIYFLGSDDFVFAPEVFDEIVRSLSVDCDMVVSPVRYSDKAKQFGDMRIYRNVLIIKPYCHQGVIMRKSLLERLDMFDDSYRIAADFKLCLLAHLGNARCVSVWREYAEFQNSNGISHSALDLELSERVRVPTEVYGLSAKESELLASKQLLPMRIVMRMLFHRNGIIRYGARHAFKRRIADLVGMLDENGGPRPLFRKL